MSRLELTDDPFSNKLAQKFMDFLPHADMMPALSAEEVEQFVAFGKLADDLLRRGDTIRATRALHKQIYIYRPNPTPHMKLALIAAENGAMEKAREHLRDAVVRGFRDLRALRRAEAWQSVGNPLWMQNLEGAVVEFARIESRWPDWSSFIVARTPDDLKSVLAGHERLVERIDAMAPALGERLTGLWYRVLDRGTAHAIATYVRKHPTAPDLEPALERLLNLYVGGPLQRWERLPAEAADRLEQVSRVVLERFPKSGVRAEALVGVALGRNAERNDKGVLQPSAVAEIRELLEEVLTSHRDSPVISIAAAGLMRTEQAAGSLDRAAARYRKFRDENAGNAEVLATTQRMLGELGLRLGGIPEFEATTLAGRSVDPDALRGKVVVLDFWATWCGPCIEEFPALRKIDARHGEEVAVLGINLDDMDDLSVDSLKEWIVRQELPGEHVHDGLGWESELVRAFGVTEIPFNVVVAADGSVVAVNEQGKRLTKAVRAALR